MSNDSPCNQDSNWTKGILSLIKWVILLGAGWAVLSPVIITPKVDKCGCARPIQAPDVLSNIDRAQQFYFINNRTFAPSLAELNRQFDITRNSFLQITIREEIGFYQYHYAIVAANDHLTIATATATATVLPKAELPSTAGRSYTSTVYRTDADRLETLICETMQPSGMPPRLEWKNGRPNCPPSSHQK